MNTIPIKISKNILIVTSLRKYKNTIVSIDSKDRNNNYYILMLGADHSPEIPLPKNVVNVDLSNYAAAESLINSQENAFNAVNKIKKAIENSEYFKYFVMNAVNLLDVSEIELHIHFFVKIFDQINLSKNLLSTLAIDEVEIETGTENFLSFRSIPYKTTFLWGIKIAAELLKIKCRTKKPNILFWNIIDLIFIVTGIFARIMVQFSRRITSKGMFKYKSSKLNDNMVFFSHAIPNALTLTPLVEEADKNGFKSIIVQVGDLGATYFGNHHVIISYEKIIDFKSSISMITHGLRLILGILNLNKIDLHSDIAGNNTSMNELFKRVMIQFGTTRISAAICYVAISEAALRKLNPKIICFTNEWNARERAISLTARMAKVRTILVQCGLCGEDPHLKYPLYAEYIALDSPGSAGIYTKYGHSSNHLFVSGQPAYSFLRKIVNNYNKNEIFDKLRIEKRGYTVVYASQCYEDEMSGYSKVPTNAFLLYETNLMQIYKELTLLAEKLNICMIVKPHPREIMEIHEKIMRNLNIKNIKLLRPDTNPYELLSICDILVSKYSAMAMETIAIAKPVILLKDDRTAEIPVFDGCELSFKANSLNDIEPLVKTIIDSSFDWADKCDKFFLSQTGETIDNVPRKIINHILPKQSDL